MGLVCQKYDKYPFDLSFSITGNDVDAYFKVMLKALSFTNPKLAAKTKHVSHGNMRLTSGKMSSRTGDIVAGEALIDSVKEAVLGRMEVSDTEFFGGEMDEISEKIAVGALKYDILKQGLGRDIIFDESKALALTGNTGPYLQYTFVRAWSVLEKAGWVLGDLEGELEKFFKEDFGALSSAGGEGDGEGGHVGGGLDEAELDVLRHLSKFSDVAKRAAEEYVPHLICNYLFGLAQKFNSFYADHPILDGGGKAHFRLLLTANVARVLKDGLWILGIGVVEKM